jgi:transcriptional regulator with XRE-family HTH domain
LPTTESLPARRQVAVELGRLRRQAGISGRAMADRLGVSQATISRAESGARLLTLPLTRAWLDAVHADEPTRNTVLALAEASHSETVAYRLRLRTQAHLQDHVTNLEAETRRLCAVDSITVHGLLQVPEYAVSIMELADTDQMIDQTAALAARLERQQLLDDDTRSFSFVMLEQVLRAPMVTAAQLLHLAAVATSRPTVTIGIVPFAAPWPAIPWSGFNLYELRDGSRVVTAELTHGESTVTGEEDLDLYADLHDRWLARAVAGEQAAELCRNLADKLGIQKG